MFAPLQIVSQSVAVVVLLVDVLVFCVVVDIEVVGVVAGVLVLCEVD